MKILQDWVLFSFLGKNVALKCGWSFCVPAPHLPLHWSGDAAVTLFLHDHLGQAQLLWGHRDSSEQGEGPQLHRTPEQGPGHSSGVVGIPGKLCSHPTFPEQLVQ